LLIPHLGGGGAERVMSLLAQGLSPEKYELHLGLITQADPGVERLPAWVHVHTLDAPRVRLGAIPLLRLIRRLKPDLILSGMAHLNFLVLLLCPFFPRGTRILVRQNATVSASLAFDELPRHTRLLYRTLYRRADRVICQSQSMAEDLAHSLKLSESRLAVLPNPVDVDGIRNFIGANPLAQTGHIYGPLLLAVGRLSREKGFDLLLHALVPVRKHFPNARLIIAGIGPEESTLRSECCALRLDEAVQFVGYLEHPWRLFPETTLFVLPSRHEGLPNALLEAAAAGLPIVALPASGGVSGLLRDQPGIWIAPEVSADALAQSLLAALHALQPSERFPHPFVDSFRLNRAIQAYERLIDQTLETSRKC
jgi:glycosyltransferase involved in cell wall biosynthesis